jgi:hypothetical protein
MDVGISAFAINSHPSSPVTCKNYHFFLKKMSKGLIVRFLNHLSEKKKKQSPNLRFNKWGLNHFVRKVPNFLSDQISYY